MLKQISTANDVADYLELQYDPTGNGWFKILHHDIKSTCQKCKNKDFRANSTTILHLFGHDHLKLWHRVKIATVYSFIAGSPILLQTGNSNKIVKTQLPGSDFISNNTPMSVVESSQWQTLSTMGDWSLISVTYSPGFEYMDLEVARSGWAPGQGEPTLSFPGEKWEP